MKRINLIRFLFLVISPIALSQEKYPVNWDYKELGFIEFVARCEKTFPARFFYNEEWIKDLKLGDYKGLSAMAWRNASAPTSS